MDPRFEDHLRDVEKIRFEREQSPEIREHVDTRYAAEFFG